MFVNVIVKILEVRFLNLLRVLVEVFHRKYI